MEQITKLVRESADGARQSAQACQDLSGWLWICKKWSAISSWTAGGESSLRARGTINSIVARPSHPWRAWLPPGDKFVASSNGAPNPA